MPNTNMPLAAGFSKWICCYINRCYYVEGTKLQDGQQAATHWRNCVVRQGGLHMDQWKNSTLTVQIIQRI